MKTHYVKKNAVMALVCVCLGIICYAATSHAASKKSDAAAQGNSDMAQLVVARNDSVGSGIDITLSVDGKSVMTLIRGRTFRGSLPPGQHVLSVRPEPNLTGQRANQAEVNAEKGHTYSFAVARQSNGTIVLLKKP